ncbi:hypothetical protein [Candidatus Nitrospira nitrificans]|uniref:DUF3618 domain-containing protein n=1 Tax=Candidatus Nitrospira nitrificans TaxID=1742973 RepID=A0A0S4LT33_9BACT|nr:hypothetical protein [Candidatus Nitrospira nitrificans]CUS39720.1 hypothetical protein COMA2_80146 [Candidatus Nitrospira nitrificans]
MDQREHDVEEDLKSIIRTRMALMDKVQSLEQRVEDTARGARENAMNTMEAAKNKAMEWMTSSRGRLSPIEMLGRRPPVIAGGVIAIGLLAIWMTQQKPHRRSGVYPYYPHAGDADGVPRKGRSGVYPYFPPRAEGADVMPQSEDARRRGSGEPHSTHARQSNPNREIKKNDGEDNSFSLPRQLSTFLHGLKDDLTQERVRLQQAALQIGRSFAQDMVHIAGQSLVSFMEQLTDAGRDQSRQHQPRGR